MLAVGFEPTTSGTEEQRPAHSAIVPHKNLGREMDSKAFGYSPTFKQYIYKYRIGCSWVLFFYLFLCLVIFVLWLFIEDKVNASTPCDVYELKQEVPPAGCYRNPLQSPSTRFCLSFFLAVTLLFVLCVVLCYRHAVSHHGVDELTSFRNLDSHTAQIGISMEAYLRQASRRLQEEVKSEIRALIAEKPSILVGLEHPNLLLMPVPKDAFHTNLKDFAFGLTHRASSETYEFHFPPPYLTVIPVLLRDVLRAVQFLHGRRIYHLDLQPKNVLVLNTSGNELGYQAIVGGFRFARSQKYFIGEDENQTLDGTKFDTWCVGLMSFEVFTGGMLTIQLEKSSISKILPPMQPTCGDFDSAVLNISFFVSAVKSRWTSHDDFEFWCNTSTEFYDLYLYFNFVRQCWNFTRGLILGRKRHGVKVHTIVDNEPIRNILKRRQKSMIFIV